MRKIFHLRDFFRMQSFFRRLVSSKAATRENSPDSDLLGFDLAESLEGGDVAETLTDWLQPVKEGGLFIVRRSLTRNEWTVFDYKFMLFIMRATVDVEIDGHFVSEYDRKVVCNQPGRGRMRVAIFLDEAEKGESSKRNPVVVMMSSADRVEWIAYKTFCEACRYKRRRSSFTEGSDSGSPANSPQLEGSSSCSFTRPSSIEDFGAVCSVVPSAQEILRMRHIQMAIRKSAFTKIKASVPGEDAHWCPLATLPSPSNPDVLLESTSPVWSESLKALALEFRHREVLPSRRNFQLKRVGQTPMEHSSSAEAVSLFYRSGKAPEYSLEVQRPLSVVQAFCMAISTMLWN